MRRHKDVTRADHCRSQAAPSNKEHRKGEPVFRCLATNITQPGWHNWETNNWETNYAASPDDAGLAADWHGGLSAEMWLP